MPRALRQRKQAEILSLDEAVKKYMQDGMICRVQRLHRF